MIDRFHFPHSHPYLYEHSIGAHKNSARVCFAAQAARAVYVESTENPSVYRFAKSRPVWAASLSVSWRFLKLFAARLNADRKCRITFPSRPFAETLRFLSLSRRRRLESVHGYRHRPGPQFPPPIDPAEFLWEVSDIHICLLLHQKFQARPAQPTSSLSYKGFAATYDISLLSYSSHLALRLLLVASFPCHTPPCPSHPLAPLSLVLHPHVPPLCVPGFLLGISSYCYPCAVINVRKPL